MKLIFFLGLIVAERFRIYRRHVPERRQGEFKFHLLQAQFSLAVVEVMVWGWGDAAALVGETYGRGKIRHRRVDGSKTIEGTVAMLVEAAPLSTVVELVSRKGIDTLTFTVISFLPA